MKTVNNNKQVSVRLEKGGPKAGLWIDRNRAVLVIISGRGEETKTVRSNIEKHFRPSKGDNSTDDYGRRDLPAYDIMERNISMHVQKFFKKIISQIRNADSVFIFGPGEIKTQLRRHIAADKFMTRNVKVETAGKMTDKEILEKVRQHYSPGLARVFQYMK